MPSSTGVRWVTILQTTTGDLRLVAPWHEVSWRLEMIVSIWLASGSWKIAFW